MRIDKGSFNKRNGRIGYFLKSETKTLKNNKIGEKKQKERRKEKSISLSRTWYIRDCKLTVNISDSTKGSAIHQY